MFFYTYIILMQNEQLYVGQTKDIEYRMKQHKEGQILGGSRTIEVRGFAKLICYWASESRNSAVLLERYLKTLTHMKKEDLIRNPHLLGKSYGVKLKDNYEFHLVNNL